MWLLLAEPKHDAKDFRDTPAWVLSHPIATSIDVPTSPRRRRADNVLNDWAFYLATVSAVIVLGLSKGGFTIVGTMATPLLVLAPGMSPVRAAAILLPLLVMGDVASVFAFRREFSAPNLRILLPGSLVGIGLGWLMAAQINEEVIRVFVGLVSIGFVIFMLLRRGFQSDAPTTPAIAPGLFWGAVAGFTSFVSHSGAPPFQVYVQPQRLAPNVFSGTATMFFAATNALKLVPYFFLGQFKTDNLDQSLELAPIALVATFAGIWIVRRINVDRFYAIILAMTFFLGAWLVYDGVAALWLIRT
jgi:uncharacterized protein